MFTGLKNKIVNVWNNNNPSEIPKTSQFYEKGILTPYEFMEAGDRLIMANPIWSWQKAGSPALEEKTLAPEKQFLAAQIISQKRLSDTGPQVGEMTTGKDGWTSIDVLMNDMKELKFDDETDAPKPEENKVVYLDDAFDSDEDIAPNAKQNQKIETKSAPVNPNKRIYNVNITYDRHYLTPRFWLSGVDYQNKPLTKDQIFEEVMGEYKDKTVTFDKHPHLDTYMANIHPCRHAEVIKTLVNQAKSNGKEIKPDKCLFIFLKFITSVVPSLEIDFTTEIEI